VADDLPKLPFLTGLDIYVIVSFFSLFLMAMEGIVLGGIATASSSEMSVVDFAPDASPEDVQHLERQVVFTMLTLWLLYQVGCVYYALSAALRMEMEVVANAKNAAENEAWTSVKVQKHANHPSSSKSRTLARMGNTTTAKKEKDKEAHGSLSRQPQSGKERKRGSVHV
jgi:hypothetical protein